MANEKRNLLPTHLSVQLKLMLLCLLSLTILRILFFIVHFKAFTNVSISDWIAGFYFDSMTVCIGFLPFSVPHLLPLPIHSNKVYHAFVKVYFILIQILILGLNLIDLEYFNFTAKRSTFDLFTMASQGEDLSQLLLTFMLDFWWIIVIFGLMVWGLLLLYKRWLSPSVSSLRFNFKSQLLGLVILAPILMIVGRGGFQLRPVGIIEAAQFTHPNNTPLILNTAFTIAKSYGEEGVEPKNFFKAKELTKHFSPIQTSNPTKIFNGKPNVVIIILESFGNEWLKKANPALDKSYTPFFDQICEEGWYFANGYANGKKSIEAMPSIVASMPSLMSNPYINSQYGNNEVQTLPKILANHGYSSAFYHGATNGSMRFDGYAALAGFQQYFGRKEYKNDKHFDGNWGILDEYFNPWSAKQMTKLKEPFFSTLFTLSSHHPYYVPENRKDSIVSGKQPIARSISYGDYALKKFFEEAKKQPWFKNTLFVLCADHTPSPTDEGYFSKAKTYGIPIVFYSPNNQIQPKVDQRILQQIDLLPTILDLANIETTYYAFGQSAFNDNPRYAISFLEGVYYYFCGQFLLQFSNNKTIAVADLYLGRDLRPEEIKQRQPEWSPFEKKLKALIQTYNRDVIENQTKVK